ncbi:hypothetical protein AJ88_24810 [Mesorhizobium amorphae CCBAU 01583]|nr:hypothetical protein AJ88_24810 [Mesorhizobium amorphae CCBAU 01583]
MERAARRTVCGIGWFAFEDDALACAPAGNRDCRDQCLRVGVGGVREQKICLAIFDDATKIHHSHTLTDLANHFQM